MWHYWERGLSALSVSSIQIGEQHYDYDSFEGLTELGELLEVDGMNPSQGLSVGGTYEVTDITESELREGVNVYHYIGDDGDKRETILNGNVFTFSIFNITH
ncbi:hypothetical protein LILPAPAWES_23 [Morganella phage vB_MmoP_Lilpapawes]|uniref:Uncharacterized protein n=1 Tax=Morganella phage vB_MmoP_Lilpapawes TaxID=2894803 RepID=A0AAE9CBL6_9CAUD|nr:hypothetical protein LILPAPAWES_23 [Morganella phage vB_MmoP_Lilpapawes]